MNEQNTNNPKTPAKDANRDPITGTPGAHPIGTGLGAAGVGAATGAVAGAIAGPVGIAAGAVVGAVVGGLAGKAAAEAVNPTIETKYWQDNYASRPYADVAAGYDQYAPAYRYGWESFGEHGTAGRTFDSVEQDLQNGWDRAKGTSGLAWDKAKRASRDAWDRVELAARGPGRTSSR